MCCFIGCKKQAEFQVWHEGCGSPECDTQACSVHLGALMGCNQEQPPWAPLPATNERLTWYVTWIGSD